MDVTLITDLSLEVARSGSDALMDLFRETEGFFPGIRFQGISPAKDRRPGEIHPASTVGIAQGSPILRCADSLRGDERIEAMAHELTHLLLVGRFGLRLIGRRMPRSRDREELLQYYLTLGRNWDYLLGQIINTVHHLILVDYLRDRWNIESRLHLRLLDHNLRILAGETHEDQESVFAKGLIAFEYERMIGGLTSAIPPSSQSLDFRKSYDAAARYFEGFTFRSLPCLSSYEGKILNFLEDLGYDKERFAFFPTVISPDGPGDDRERGIMPTENVLSSPGTSRFPEGERRYNS